MTSLCDTCVIRSGRFHNKIHRSPAVWCLRRMDGNECYRVTARACWHLILPFRCLCSGAAVSPDRPAAALQPPATDADVVAVGATELAKHPLTFRHPAQPALLTVHTHIAQVPRSRQTAQCSRQRCSCPPPMRTWWRSALQGWQCRRAACAPQSYAPPLACLRPGDLCALHLRLWMRLSTCQSSIAEPKMLVALPVRRGPAHLCRACCQVTCLQCCECGEVPGLLSDALT